MSGITLNELLSGILVVVLFILFLGLILAFNSIKIVPEEKRLAVFRLGRFIGVHGPGIVVLFPIIDRGIWVELQQTFRFEYANLTTYDNRQASMTVSLKGRIVDVEKAVMNVPNLKAAIQTLIEKRAKEFVQSKSSGEIRIQLKDLEEVLLDGLNMVKGNWGFEVSELRIENVLTKS